MTKRILLIRKGALGDVLCTTPVARRLRLENPGASIHVQTFHGAAYLDSPFIDAILDPNEAAPDDYDQVIDLGGVYESARKLHPVDAFFMAAFGDAQGDKSFYLAHPSGLPQFRFSFDYSRAVVIHPNTSWPSRTLPTALWQAISERLIAKGFDVVVTGKAMDVPPQGARIFDLRGKLSLAHQAALVSKSCAALFGQSGMTALAATTDTPLVSFYTITRPEFEMPYRHGELGWNCTALRTPMPCFACYEDYPSAEFYLCERGDNACVTSSFDPDFVVEQTLKAIENDKRKTL